MFSKQMKGLKTTKYIPSGNFSYNVRYFMKLSSRTFLLPFILLLCGLVCGSFLPKNTPSGLYGIRTICIDAGHGGKDPGCHGNSFKEKDVALAIAMQLGKYIEQNMKDVKVVYTRTTDVFVELADRANIANKAKADLFICIHCNSACVRDKKARKDVCKPEVHGSETYVMGLHKTNANLEVAKRENSSILLENDYKTKYDGFDPESDEGYILMNLTQNAYMESSLKFASFLQKNMKGTAGRSDKGVKQAGFLVLWRTAMPSVLVETGYLTNEEEHDFLGSKTGMQYMAASMFKALREYKDQLEGRDAKYDDEFTKMLPYIPVTKSDTAGVKDIPVVKDTVSPPPVRKDSIVKKDTTRVPVKNKYNIIFRVQFYSSGNKVTMNNEKFKSLRDVYEYTDKGTYKYTAGQFDNPEEALNYQKEVAKMGYKDAFVVAFKAGKRIPYSDAVKLIKQ